MQQAEKRAEEEVPFSIGVRERSDCLEFGSKLTKVNKGKEMFGLMTVIGMDSID